MKRETKEFCLAQLAGGVVIAGLAFLGAFLHVAYAQTEATQAAFTDYTAVRTAFDQETDRALDILVQTYADSQADKELAFLPTLEARLLKGSAAALQGLPAQVIAKRDELVATAEGGEASPEVTEFDARLEAFLTDIKAPVSESITRAER